MPPDNGVEDTQLPDNPLGVTNGHFLIFEVLPLALAHAATTSGRSQFSERKQKKLNRLRIRFKIVSRKISRKNSIKGGIIGEAELSKGVLNTIFIKFASSPFFFIAHRSPAGSDAVKVFISYFWVIFILSLFACLLLNGDDDGIGRW